MLDWVGWLLTRRFFERPIFVLGAPRSGTTALLGALGKHRHVLAARIEHPFVGHLSRMLYAYEFGPNRCWLADSLAVSKPDLHRQLRRLVVETGFGRHYGLRTLAINLVRGDPCVLVKRRWCAKTYLSYEGFQGIRSLYPDARFVHIVRNGCDVVLSRMRFAPFASQPFERHCREWADSVAAYRYVSDAACCIRARHEDLVAEPERVSAQLLDFVELPPDPAPADYLQRTMLHPLAGPTERDVDVQSSFAARAPSYAGWSAAQRDLFRMICGEAMEEAGYAMPF